MTSHKNINTHQRELTYTIKPECEKSFEDIANHLNSLGISTIPVSLQKTPTCKAWKCFQSRIPTYKELTYRYGIGLICGHVSGNIEALDFDIKYDKSGHLFKSFCKLVNDSFDFRLLDRLVWQQTKSGGYHALYRCSKIEGNQKLASNRDKETLIETRGEGGYVVIAPSSGYILKRGTFYKISTISEEERELLHDCARSFCQLPKEPPSLDVQKTKAVPKNSNLPDVFGAFNERVSCLEVLLKVGWKVNNQLTNTRKIYVIRSGTRQSETPQSGNILKAKNLFTCWSSSGATQLNIEAGKPYNPASLYTHIFHGGNFSEASRTLFLEYGFGKYGKEEVLW